ncbi:MAG: PhzF family phenazine biosynthesis protein [Defluviitaleaceae bacterium]|nr:PhzF family phenazine biosynthesis protein [Defluviitaleaceae bacterium]
MKFYQVDAFTDKLFGGNPAAVCLVYDQWPEESLMQAIAAENNLSETAFVLDVAGQLAIRWFTPTVEVPLCGHATLAAAHVMFNHENFGGDTLVLNSRNHVLKVAYEGDFLSALDEGKIAANRPSHSAIFPSGVKRKDSDVLTLDFPADHIWQIPFEAHMDCFNAAPMQAWRGTEEYLLVFENQSQIENMVCDLAKATKIDMSGFIVTAPADMPGVDFVSRYFAPKIGIDEDPVTGSAHTLLAPYWKEVLGKDNFTALQLSRRVGRLFCRIEGDRVKIGGKAITFAVGEILL